jgi:hypothetical protein
MATLTPILLGGLGNRLYQIANSFKLQKKYGFDLKLYRINPQDIDALTYRTFVVKKSDFDDFGGHNIIVKENLPQTIDQLFSKLNFNKTPITIDEIISDKKLYFEGNIGHIDNTINSAIMGYFFTYSEIVDEIELVKNSINECVNQYIISKYPELLSEKILGIHLRLGIATDNFAAIDIPKTFYENIINIEKNNYDTIFIVSDNIEYAKQFVSSMNTMGKNIKFIEDEPMFVDMLILSYCTTLIIGNSTLSAWSGYFNKYNNVYVPNVWINHHGTSDLPKEWKIL